MFDTDGYCWYAETGSAKKGRFYESCRCCSMYHSSDPSNVVAHIRTSKEMKCKCALNAPCKCKYGPQPPLFVVGRCTGKRIRRTRRGVSSGERALYEERVSHDSSFCRVNKAEMVAAVNMANMKAKARTAQSCLAEWTVTLPSLKFSDRIPPRPNVEAARQSSTSQFNIKKPRT